MTEKHQTKVWKPHTYLLFDSKELSAGEGWELFDWIFFHHHVCTSFIPDLAITATYHTGRADKMSKCKFTSRSLRCPENRVATKVQSLHNKIGSQTVSGLKWASKSWNKDKRHQKGKHQPCFSVLSSMLTFSSSEKPKKLRTQSWKGGTLNSDRKSSLSAWNWLKQREKTVTHQCFWARTSAHRHNAENAGCGSHIWLVYACLILLDKLAFETASWIPEQRFPG